MAALVLRRLEVPGAYLAAAVFALHPVHVESVAWITEQKNTLFAVFYLAAMLVYLRFDQSRKLLPYCCALGLFVLGLESKTITATLPAALLVIFWWQRGRLPWRRDVLPLLPFLVLGAAAGVVTAVFERKLIGAEGAEFDLPVLDRCLIAGRAICFYLGKLLWPADLIFIYPRWHIDPSDWRQYLYPAAAIGLLAAAWAAWAVRRRRGPLAALLYFVGTLFPVLGFCNVYPFVYSFVANHFQYLASLGVITLVSAGITVLWQRLACFSPHSVPLLGTSSAGRKSAGQHGFCEAVAHGGEKYGLVSAAGIGLCLTLLTVLGTLTWRQSSMYADVKTLYETTIDRNPDCWMAELNLGACLADEKKFTEAIPHYQRALAIRPGYVKAIRSLGVAAAALGRTDEAIARYHEALKIKPDDADAHYNLANLLVRMERLDDAIGHYQQAIEYL